MMSNPDTATTTPPDTELIAELDAAVEEYRAQMRAASLQRQEDIGTPFGVDLDRLNRQWSEVKAAHDAKIKVQREAYIAQRDELLAKIEAYRKDHPKPTPRPTKGRPKFEYNDRVKVAAYRLFLARGKGMVRRIMGGSIEALTLNTLLAEGKDLHEAQLATEGEW